MVQIKLYRGRVQNLHPPESRNPNSVRAWIHLEPQNPSHDQSSNVTPSPSKVNLVRGSRRGIEGGGEDHSRRPFSEVRAAAGLTLLQLLTRRSAQASESERSEWNACMSCAQAVT